MWLKQNPFISLILNLLRFGVASGSLQDAEALLSDLLANYEKQLPPRLNQSDITTVDLGFSFVSLNELKEITGRLELTIAVSLVWKEERFIWNPENYGGTSIIRVKIEDMWHPVLTIEESVNSVQEIGSSSN